MHFHFTKHALQRMKRRGILKHEVEEALERTNTQRIIHFSTERGNIEICIERTKTHIKVITVYWV
ncbi:DUF4258 domain-containing protein [Candidatus Woesearchaeota archaeon]|nr:DUF4258 domain-containing protein [Candidatus Woesearchaeota archaeon]